MRSGNEATPIRRRVRGCGRHVEGTQDKRDEQVFCADKVSVWLPYRSLSIYYRRTMPICRKILAREVFKGSELFPRYSLPLADAATANLTPLQHVTWYSTGTDKKPASVLAEDASKPAEKTITGRLKIIIREYGVVAIVFHTIISFASLGTCYMIVKS